MARFYGMIGYVQTVEKRPGVWEEQVTEMPYYGDIERPVNKIQQGVGLNDDINFTNQLSIVSDPFAYENFQSMRYVVIFGTKWKVTSVEVKYPRLLLTIGGVYNDAPTE